MGDPGPNLYDGHDPSELDQRPLIVFTQDENGIVVGWRPASENGFFRRSLPRHPDMVLSQFPLPPLPLAVSLGDRGPDAISPVPEDVMNGVFPEDVMNGMFTGLALPTLTYIDRGISDLSPSSHLSVSSECRYLVWLADRLGLLKQRMCTIMGQQVPRQPVYSYLDILQLMRVYCDWEDRRTEGQRHSPQYEHMDTILGTYNRNPVVFDQFFR